MLHKNKNIPKMYIPLLMVIVLTLALIVTGCFKKEAKKEIILATTTSTQDSGLLDKLIPLFEQKTGYKVKIIAVGSGQALAMGERGDADVLLVHSPQEEEKLVKKNAVINRHLVMHNDFILVGPEEDPAGVRNTTDIFEAFKAIAKNKALFVSRGDNSGTHKKELEIWKGAGISDFEKASWYQSTGQGMGASLDVASEKKAYILTDRATFLAKKKKLDLVILKQGDKNLLNIYHVMQPNPEYIKGVNPGVAELLNVDGAEKFIQFMIDSSTQKIIGEFGKDIFGEPLFTPDAGKNENDFKLEN